MHAKWRQLVRTHLPSLRLPPEREEEIIEELAQLLEEYAAERGLDPGSEDEISEWLRTQVPHWEDLAREIQLQQRPFVQRRPMSPARRGARRDRARAAIDTIRLECRHGLRRLAKDRGFTVAALLTLVVGIGLNTAVFSVVNAVLFKPLPVAESERLVNVYTSDSAASSTSQMPTSFPDFEDLQTDSESLAELAGYTMVEIVLEVHNTSELATAEMVTGNYFTTLGVTAALGRTITQSDDRPGQPNPVAVLSHSGWQRRFGADPEIIGDEIRVNGQPYTIIGVAPAGFHGLIRGFSPPLWIPVRTGYTLGATATIRMGTPTAGVDRLADRNPRWIMAFGRLQPEATVAQAESEVAALAARLRQAYPETNERRSFLLVPTDTVRVVPMVDSVLYGSSAVVMAIVVLILLIASTNIANMLLARVNSRRKEIVTRLALGAGRATVMRQLLIESLLLALGGGALGLCAAFATNRSIAALDLPVTLDLSLDLRVFFFTFAVATLCAIAFGLAPACVATRVNLTSALRSDSRGATSTRARSRLRSALVVAQVAASMMLLICAGLSVRSMLNAHRVDPGFDPSGVVVAEFAPNLQGYPPARVEQFYRSLTEQIGALSGVRSIGFANHLPLTFALSSAGVAAEGRDSMPTEEWPQIGRSLVSPGYFETMRIPLLRGRAFAEHDAADTAPVAIVNESLAALLWPGQEVVGKRLRVDDGSEGYYLVVGVARDGKYWTLGEEARPYIFRSLTQHPEGQRNLVVRYRGNPGVALTWIRQTARELDQRIAVTGLETLEERVSDSLLLPRASAMVFGFSGLVGLLLAAFGLYGVIAYGVSQRTREIGIRMAMGAEPLSILRLAVRETVLLTVLGVALGIACALATTRALSAVLYGISATDPMTFVLVPVFLVLVALVASLIPARRAATIDPVQALRHE